MRKKIVSLFLVLVLTMSFGSVAFASTEIIDDPGIDTHDTNAVIFDIDRTSATTADVYVDVYFSQTVDIYNVVVYLQKKVDGEWVIDTSNPERTLYNNGFNKTAFYFYNHYTGLNRNTSYRIRVVSKDTIGSSVHTYSAYSSAF
mgnify:FL=1